MSLQEFNVVTSDVKRLCGLNTEDVVLEMSDNSNKADEMPTMEKLQSKGRNVYFRERERERNKK